MTTKKHTRNPLPVSLQNIFIGFGGVAYVLQTALLLQVIDRAYPDVWRLSPFLVLALGLIVVPVLVFGISYSVLRKLALRQRLFAAVFLAVMWLMMERLTSLLLFVLSSEAGLPLTPMWLTLSPLIIASAGYAVLLHQFMRAKATQLTIPASVQKSFIGVAASITVLHILTLVTRAIQQYPTNPNLSSSVTPTIEQVLLPLIFFAVAYVIVPANLPRLTRLFRLTTWAVGGVLLLSVVSQVVTTLYGYPDVDAGYWQMMSYNYGDYIITLGIYITILLHPTHRQQD